MVVGYGYFRSRRSRLGGRSILLWSLAVSGLVPAVLAGLTDLTLVVLISAVGAFFAAGTDLALFDEMMMRIPRVGAVRYAGIDYALVNLAGIVAPIAAAAVATVASLEAGILVGAAVSGIGVLLFWRQPVVAAEAPFVPPLDARQEPALDAITTG
jgi:hypothetical protein